MAVFAVWVRSYMVTDRHRWDSVWVDGPELAYRGYRVSTGMGGLRIIVESRRALAANIWRRSREPQFVSADGRWHHNWSTSGPQYPMRDASDDALLSQLGFQFNRLPGQDRTELTMPFWAAFALTAAFPLGHFVAGVLHRQREDRLALGLCPRCGVALTSDSDRCPGCDKPVAVARQSLESR
jgi:hypothetical protein